MSKLLKLCQNMIQYYSGDPKRIQHFIKVHSFCKIICEMEQVDEQTQLIAEISGYVHDIGIKIAEQKYGYSNGKLQEKEGSAVAKKMLTELGFENDVIEQVCYVIAHHHTYDNIDTLPYQILVESDFIVNCYEHNETLEAMQSVYNKIFQTKSGKQLFYTMFLQK